MKKITLDNVQEIMDLDSAIIMFTTNECPVCKSTKEELQKMDMIHDVHELELDKKDAGVYPMNELGIKSVPTFIGFIGGKAVVKINGFVSSKSTTFIGFMKLVKSKDYDKARSSEYYIGDVEFNENN